jgi:aspartokinase-like uncharacterized kinase
MHDLKVLVKVGGSLLDWPELGPRLVCWLDTFSSKNVLLVPGGGPTVDVIRNLDRVHGLGEEAAHWLALRALTLNAHFLATLLKPLRAVVIPELRDAEAVWERQELPILDPFHFAREDAPECIPHCWSATTDSLAAQIAVRIQASKLLLLKSTDIPDDWINPSRGIVDPYFEKIIQCSQTASDPPLVVEALNFRSWGLS